MCRLGLKISPCRLIWLRDYWKSKVKQPLEMNYRLQKVGPCKTLRARMPILKQNSVAGLPPLPWESILAVSVDEVIMPEEAGELAGKASVEKTAANPRKFSQFTDSCVTGRDCNTSSRENLSINFIVEFQLQQHSIDESLIQLWYRSQILLLWL